MDDNPTNTIVDIRRLLVNELIDENVVEDMKIWPFKVVQGEYGQAMIKCNCDGV